MVTKEEFKELKKTYWNKDYAGKIIVITDNLPKKLLIIVPYDRVIKDDIRHQIIELTKNSKTYYGCCGKQIQGRYIDEFYYNKDELIIQGRKGREKLLFFLDKSRYSRAVNLSMLKLVMCPKFCNFFKDIKRNQINTRGLLRCFSDYSWYCTLQTGKLETNAIEKYFGFKPKDLRELQENFNGRWQYNLIDTVNSLKQLFSASTKDICRYIVPFENLNYTEMHPITKEDAKKLRIKLRYMADLQEAGLNISLYRDYRRCVEHLDTESQKQWPLYPKNFSSIETLHNEVTEVLNRDRERIQAAKQAERQQKYAKEFYSKACKLEMSDDVYSIIACKDLTDLVKEGRCLNHCVGSYITSVSEGREFILFLRKKKDLDTPFFTIDVTPDKKVRQIHGNRNSNLTKEVKPFVDKWAKKFDLDISNCSGIYGALRY